MLDVVMRVAAEDPAILAPGRAALTFDALQERYPG
jgi:hypothetical protein